MKTFKFSLVLRTRENTDVFITLDDNIYGIHSKRVNILYILKAGFAPTEYSKFFPFRVNPCGLLVAFLHPERPFLYRDLL